MDWLQSLKVVAVKCLNFVSNLVSWLVRDLEEVTKLLQRFRKILIKNDKKDESY